MKKIGLMKSKAFVIYTKKDLIKSITKVRDHCYCTGKYRRAAHDICNPRHKTSNRIPVVFPDSSTYDYHFVISEQLK